MASFSSKFIEKCFCSVKFLLLKQDKKLNAWSIHTWLKIMWLNLITYKPILKVSRSILVNLQCTARSHRESLLYFPPLQVTTHGLVQRFKVSSIFYRRCRALFAAVVPHIPRVWAKYMHFDHHHFQISSFKCSNPYSNAKFMPFFLHFYRLPNVQNCRCCRVTSKRI